MKKILFILLISFCFCSEYSQVPYEFSTNKTIPADFLNFDFQSLKNSITDGSYKINVGELNISGNVVTKNIIIDNIFIDNIIRLYDGIQFGYFNINANTINVLETISGITGNVDVLSFRSSTKILSNNLLELSSVRTTINNLIIPTLNISNIKSSVTYNFNITTTAPCATSLVNILTNVDATANVDCMLFLFVQKNGALGNRFMSLEVWDNPSVRKKIVQLSIPFTVDETKSIFVPLKKGTKYRINTDDSSGYIQVKKFFGEGNW